MTSPNGTNWTIGVSAADNNWNSVCYGAGKFVAVSITGSGNRVMTGVDNSCFLKGSLILTSTGEYIPIEQLRSDDLIQTYKNGNKKIVNVGKKEFSNSTSNICFSLYVNKENKLIISGGHSILVDKLTEDQNMQQKKLGFASKIEDKHLLLACYSDLFKQVEIDNEIVEMWHLCLENEDLNGHYGIWANNMLTESTSINNFKIKGFEPN
jgi:hypothetical protein